MTSTPTRAYQTWPRSPLHIAISTLLAASAAGPAAAWAEDTLQLDRLQIEDRAEDSNPYAEPGAPYKAKRSGDERYQKDLAETPKNISVLTKTQIEDSGLTDLREILDAQPGITLGTGENGNAFGDRYIIRGQEARSDVFVDGLRDPGMTIRESFAVEQVEITKGPDSSFGGRGTTGGAINSITKQASTAYDFNKVTLGLGTDRHSRLTLDANKVLSDTVAVRANALVGYEQVPDRAPADRQRNGLALSAVFKPTEKLTILTDYYGLDAKDKPDLGSFLVGSVANGDRRPASNVPVYLQDQDFLSAQINTFTTRVRYQFSPDVRLSNATRYGMSDNDYVATGARAAVFGPNDPNAGKSTISLSTHQGWQEVQYFANQTNLFVDHTLAGMKHQFNFGLEYTNHQVLNGIYNVANSGQNCITGNGTVNNNWCVVDGSGQVIPNINQVMNRQIRRDRFDQDWNIKTWSLSVMDTVDLSSKWTAFGGIRHDNYDYTLITQSANLQLTPYTLNQSINNMHAGLTYKVRPNGNVYLSYATASDINGGESDVGASSAYGGLAIRPDGQYNGRPEKTRSIELGTKWNLMDNKLLATAALFDIRKTDVFEAAITNPGDPNRYDNLGTLNTGENQVRGVEFGLTGNITSQLQVQAGIAVMDAQVNKSNVPTRVGKTLSNFADQSASVLLKYQVTPVVGVGTQVRYESERYAGQPDTAPSFDAEGRYTQPLPSYTVTDLFATYKFSNKTQLRANLANVFNQDYYLAGYQSGSFLYKGTARNLKVVLSHDF